MQLLSTFTISDYSRLAALNEADRKRALTEKARNNLESFVLDMNNKIYSSEWEGYLTEEEREQIGKACSEVSS